jgi:predicted CXXCH cytochrome family protein
VYAAKHPVPLEKDTDSKKCLECHEDHSKGKAVHSAIQTGCTSCHEVRVNKDVTRVKLITTTTVALCVNCHGDKKAADIKGKVHEPAVRDCVKCHDPHTADNKNQLLKSTSGGKDENLCLKCHKMGVDVPEKGSRHAALDMGCETCHVTHKTGERGKREFDFHLTKDAPALCIDCHDPKDATIAKAHNDQPIAKADCLTCHDPHQSAGKKLARKFTHAVFSDKDSCATCHEAPRDGKVVLNQKDSKTLCLSCHDEKSKFIESAKIQHPGAMGDCTDCHNPHASKSPGLPKTNPVDICLGCHSDQAEQGKKAHVHQPAFEQGCATCHEPHGGENLHLLRAKTPNALCLECHGPEAKPEALKDSHLMTIFEGKVKLPEDYFRKVVRLPLRYGIGHPVDKHPVTNYGDKQINCMTCHQPHSSAQPNLLVKDQTGNMAFCSTCHQTMNR